MAVDLMGEPLTLAEMRAQLGMRTDFRDDEIARNIKAARRKVEGYTEHALTRRRERETFPLFVDAGQATRRLRWKPVVQIDAVSIIGADGIVPVPGVFQAVELVDGFHLLPPAGGAWPVLASGAYVQVEYTAGYLQSEVPDDLVKAMQLLVSHWFENHEAAVVATVAKELPFGVTDLCRDYRGSGLS